MWDKKKTVPDAVPISLETAKYFLDEMKDPTKSPQCTHCRGIHDRACPRVKRLVFAPAGQIIEVEFWKTWDATGVIWPEELAGIVLAAENAKLEADKEK